MKEKLRVLFVDDDLDVLEAYTLTCEDRWQIRTVPDAEAVMTGQVKLEEFDAVITDLAFNTTWEGEKVTRVAPTPWKGMELLRWIKEHHGQKPLVVISAVLTPELRMAIRERYPKVLCLAKPLNTASPQFHEQIEKLIADT